MDQIKLLLANIDKPDSTSIDVYIDGGGYKAAQKALAMKPEEVIQLVKDSELRGRGGARFPTGVKWGFVPQKAPKTTHLLCNAHEAGAGALQDRGLIEEGRHTLIHGKDISAHVVCSRP